MDKSELPLSRHDLQRIKNVLARIDMREPRRGREYESDEVVISSKRVKGKFTYLKVYGATVRLSNKLGLNEGLLIRQGRKPVSFDFEGEL